MSYLSKKDDCQSQILKMWKHLLVFGLVACATARHFLDVNNQKIVGGEPVDIEDFPYQLSLELELTHNCGAVILNPTHAITAAHCVVDAPKNKYRLRSGTNQHGTGGTIHVIEEIIVHPEYNVIEFDYDVAIIMVKNPFQYSITTQPISIGEATPEEDELVTVSGWGDLGVGTTPDLLNAVTIPVVDAEECASRYESYGYRPIITDRMFCAGQKGRNAFQGDSGGPITFDGELIGVVSWGSGFAYDDRPAVYTRLANPDIRAWVEKNSGSYF